MTKKEKVGRMDFGTGDAVEHFPAFRGIVVERLGGNFYNVRGFDGLVRRVHALAMKRVAGKLG